MQSAFLLSGLETRYPPQISARIVAALRQDPLVWAALEDEELYQRVMEAERGNPLFWSPANIGLILLGGDLKAETLAANQMPALDSGLRQQGLTAYEEAARRGTAPANLREAVFLALAMRERRRTTGNWNGLANELLFSGEDGKAVLGWLWKTPLAILSGIIPDSTELYTSLLKSRDIKVGAEWILHCLLAVPYEESDQARKLANLLIDVPANRQIEVLKSLKSRGQDDLTMRTANLLLNGHPLFTGFKMKMDLDQASADALAARALTLQQLSAFNQLAGSPAQAEACMRMAKAVLLYWQKGLDVQSLSKGMSEGNENALKSVAENLPQSKRLLDEMAGAMIKNLGGPIQPALVEGIQEHPAGMLCQALAQKKDGAEGIARELGARAAAMFVERLREQTRPFVGDFSLEWDALGFIKGLSKLELFDEAEECAEEALRVRPTDPALLGMYSDLLVKKGKFRKARGMMRLAVALAPTSVEIRRKLAETDERGGEWGEAFVHRKNILVFDDGELSSTVDKIAYVRAAVRAGHLDQACETCGQILAHDPDQADAQGWLGTALAQQGKYEDAALHLSKATLLDPEKADWWLELAGLYRDKGDRRTAYDTLRAAVMAAPEAGAVYYELGEMLLEDGLSSEALPYLRRAGEIQPDDEKISLRLSKALHHLGHLTEARFVVERVRSKWNQQPELAYEYADLAVDMDDLEEAIPALEMAVRSEQPRAEWLLKYAKILLNDKVARNIEPTRGAMRFEQAEAMLQKALQIRPADLDARILMADTLRKQGAYEKALGFYQALAEDPGLSEPEDIWKVQHGLGLTALELNMVEPALASIRDAAARRPNDLGLQHDLARAYLLAGLPKEAARVAENALDLDVSDIGNLNWFAELMERTGNTDRAEEALRTAVQLSPCNTNLVLRLAQLQAQNGKEEDARATLGQLTGAGIQDVDLLRQAAYLYMQMEDLPAALDCLERAAQGTEQPDAGLLFELARLYEQSGDPAEALAVAEKAVSNPIQDARQLLYLAGLRGKNKQFAAAQSALEKALAMAQNEPVEQREALESEIYRMMAASMLNTGSLTAALNHAEKALERAPHDGGLRTQTAELALALLKIDRAHSVANQNDAEDAGQPRGVKLALIGAETALELGNLDEAVTAWEEIVGDPAWKAWQLAIEARLDARGGDWIRAEEIARKALETAAESGKEERESLLWAGKAAIEAGLWKDGLRAFDTYIEEFPVEPRGPFELGKALVLIAERERDCRELSCSTHSPGASALSDTTHSRFKRLLEQAMIATQSPDALRWLARGELAFAPSLQTIKEFGRIANAPVDTAAIVRALRSSGNWPSAALAAQQAPDEPDVQMQLGLGYLVEDPECGYEMVSNLCGRLPRNPFLKILEYILAERLKKVDEAVAALEEALSYWPDEPCWQAAGAEKAEESGDIQKAILHWKAAVQQQPDNPHYTYALGKAYLTVDQFSEAVVTLDRAAHLSPEEAERWILLATAAKMAGQLGEAMEAAQRANQVDLENVSGILLTSDIAREMGDANTAEEYARLAMRRDPTNPEAVLVLSKALNQAGQDEQSLGIIEEKLAELTPSLPLLFERARLVYKLKGAPAASTLLAKLVQAYPDDLDALAMMAKVQMESGDKKGAQRSAAHALRLDAEQPELSLILGKLERENGQLDQAVHYLSETIRMEPGKAEGYLELAQTYIDRREHSSALEVYRRAIKAIPQDKRAYCEAAAIFKDSKDYLAAETMLNQAAKLDPEDLQIRRQLIAVMALNLIHKSQEASTPV